MPYLTVSSIGTYHDQYNGAAGEPVTYRPLSDAPIRIKLGALKVFPNLFAAIEASQDRLVKDIESSNSEWDEFVKSLPPIKEGK